MILEHALLSVRPGLSEDFLRAFEQARPLIAAAPGFRSLRLSSCLERADTFLFLVEWETVVDHAEGFRGSPQYQQWKSLLHHFYEPFPLVEHFLPEVTQAPVLAGGSPAFSG